MTKQDDLSPPQSLNPLSAEHSPNPKGIKLRSDGVIAAATEVTEVLKAMSNRYRLTILCYILDKESSVGGLQQYLGLKQSVVSQHLAVLRNNKIVKTRREGQTIYYSIASETVRGVLNHLCDALPAPCDES